MHIFSFFPITECVFLGGNNLLKCRSNHEIEIDNVLVLSNRKCPAYDIFNVKKCQRNDIKSNISEECRGTCEILNDYPNNTSIYFHCEGQYDLIYLCEIHLQRIEGF